MKLDFSKGDGLIPVIIQDYLNYQVLMLGYMNKEAFDKTQKDGIVTFFSRSKQRLWTKGETSGNFLHVKSIETDCDNDTLLIKIKPDGHVCHNGTTSCFGEEDIKGFLYKLENTIDERVEEASEDSYTFSLFKKGINKIAQKVGEEAVETVIEAKDENLKLLTNEASDLIYHLLIMLRYKNLSLKDIEAELFQRSRK